MEFKETIRLMVASDRYRVLHDYEAVFVQRDHEVTWPVGDFYGDPHAALITWDEQWAVVVGEGILLIHLPLLGKPPHRQLHLDTAQSLSGALKVSVEQHGVPCLTRLMGGGPGWIGWEATWFEAVYQADVHLVRLVGDPYGKEPGIYQIDVSTFEVSRIYPPQAP